MTEGERRITDYKDHRFLTWNRQKGAKNPLLIKKAEGVYFWDADDNRYLDFSSQLMCSNLGHKNQAITEAIVKQAETLPYVAPGFATDIMIEALECLRDIMPKSMNRFFLSTSGTEANEAAIKMVRQACAPAYKIISRYKSYHGATAASMSVTGDPRRWHMERARYSIGGTCFAPDCYCYRCPFNLTYPGCGVQCAKYVDYMVKEEGNVAAMIVEPIVGTNGRLIPPPEYYPMIREICDDNDMILIADEVMSGWFRTGTAFAMERWNTLPDIMTTAKGASGSYTPLAITAATEKVTQYFEDEVFCHGHTYAYHPLCAAAIPASIRELKRVIDSGLPERVSAYMKEKLFALAEKHICIGDVRGVGHFWALELVKNRQTKEPFNTKADKFFGKPLMAGTICGNAMKKGLYLVPWYDTLTLAPPLIITEAEVDEAADILDSVLDIADKEAVDSGVAVSHSTEYGDR